MDTGDVSVVIPAKNEVGSLQTLIPEIQAVLKDAEIIVVNDGSEDDTSEICKSLGVIEVSHPYSMGNGAAIKSGARKAKKDVVVFMDGDGQHDPKDIPTLLKKIDLGFDMAVGARNNASQASIGRLAGNVIYNRLATFVVGHKVEDLTSGFRAVKRKKFLDFLYLLPNGFSYPTTITMSFFRAGYKVSYVPIVARKRKGDSHISLLKDGVKFLLIIFKVGTLYSPLKIFLPISAVSFVIGLSHYLYTYMVSNTFTNMSALFLTTSIIIFLIGLVSEQITMLIYKDT